MKYQQPSFSVNLGSKDFSAGWDRIFGPNRQSEPEVEAPKVEPLVIPETLSEQVEQFHQVYGQPIAEKPTVPSSETLRLRLRLVTEEVFELLEAAGCNRVCWFDARDAVDNSIQYLTPETFDMVETVDALADLDYVVEGFRKTLGVDGKPVAREVHRSNLSKLGADGKPVIRTDGKVIKGPNFSPPDILGELLKQGYEQ